jgi:hypothetical protein
LQGETQVVGDTAAGAEKNVVVEGSTEKAGKEGQKAKKDVKGRSHLKTE